MRKKSDKNRSDHEESELEVHLTAKEGKKNNKRKGLRLFFRTLFLLLVAGILASVLFIFGLFITYSNEFDHIKPETNSTQMVFYDRNGQEIYRNAGAAESERVALNDIPDVVKESTLAAEDLDFYKHGPIDIKSIARAAILNYKNSDNKGLERLKDLLNENSYSSGGGSTITQQLVKNLYLTPEKSWQRKIKEIIFSYKLENKYSKDQILEMYLNEIYYGAQSLGIKNAAKTYFNKEVKDLDLAEASMLAGLPQAPTYYSPLGDNEDASKKRQEYVLQQMYLAHYISLDEAKQAANQELTYYGQQITLNKYPFFNQYVKEELSTIFEIPDIESRGLKVYTTLDPTKQEIAEKAIKDQLVKLSYRGASNAASVIEDPKTGEILAMVGGADYEKSKVNVATSLRQPGSSFKPIVYTAGLEKGYTAATILNDKYVNFGGIPPYTPKNYDGRFHGYVTIRNALAQSLNIPAVEMGKLVGIDKVIETAHALGITDINNKPESYGLSLSLGSGEVKLTDMVNVYSTFANGGKKPNQTSIFKIVDSKNDTINLSKPSQKQVISKETSFILSSILSDNNARSGTFGTASPLKTTKTTAVKTGTTDNYADSWTMGFSPSLVVGVWMGNNDHKPMRQISGIEGAAYIWHDIMEEGLKSLPNEAFVKPEGVNEAWISPTTGTLAKYRGRPNILEFFKSGTEPRDKIDLSYLKQF
jgi:1A family penicillin-binding protein